MENQEKDTLFLMVLSAFGAVLASSLATYLQLIIVIPLTIAVFLIMILTWFLYKKKAIHWSENLETLAMVIVLISIVISFIYLFKPA
ncbi:MAG TPA: hydrogenase [Methanobacterium sp.]|nr:hydrogenase [Methanobacterium sp.]